ncbi:NAD-dependent dehydratase, partial [Pseudomonas syringae pv. tagetis]
RRLLAVDNLADVLVVCVGQTAAADQTVLDSGGDEVSTTRLLREIRKALAKPAPLLPLPAPLQKGVASMLGKKAISQR